MKKIILSAMFVLFAISISLPALCPAINTLERASTLVKWKFYDEAIVELNRVIPEEKEPWLSRAQFLKAYCMYKKGDYDNSLIIFKDLALTPDFALWDYAKFYIGEIYFDQKQYQKAIVQYKEIFNDSALRSAAIMRKAECLEKLGDVDNAIETYKVLIAEGSTIAPLDKARLNLGKLYEKTGNPKGALKVYHELNMFNPLSPLMKEALGRISAISKAYKIYPEQTTAEEIYSKAMVYYNFGDFNSAGITFQRIINGYKTSSFWEESLFKAAMCDYKRKRLPSSVSKFKTLIARGGDYAAAAQFYIAFSYGKSGYFYQTLESLNKVITKYPNSEYADDAYYYLGFYYETNNFKDTALTYFEKLPDLYPRSEFAAEAYWKAGRLHYFKKEYLVAYEAFKRAVERCSTGEMLETCAYWKGLVQEKLSDNDGAVTSYQFVSNRYDHTYYGYRAKEKLMAFGKAVSEDKLSITELPVIGDENFADVPFEEEPLPFEPGVEEHFTEVNGAFIRVMDIKDHFKKYMELMSIGFYDDAAIEASALIVSSPDDKKNSAKVALATAQLASGKVRESISFAENLCNNSISDGSFRGLPKQTWSLAYPKGFYKYVNQYAVQYGLDEHLVLAVIREESRFNAKTVSWANARGLMQIIPPTGYTVAKQAGVRNYYTGRLHDPDTNIKMGCFYLAQLLKRFDGNKVLAIAAYNGGPGRVSRWMKKWQAEVGPNVDMDEFVESIPLSETRRYVQKVLKSYYEYRRLYTNQYPVIIKS